MLQLMERFPATETRREFGVRTVRVALAGCGTVGGGLLRLLEEESDAIQRTHGVRFEVVRVLVRDAGRARAVDLRGSVVTTDVASFLATDADLVVEAIGGIEPALAIARAALGGGRAFVTANKALVAAHGAELARLARESGATLGYEAAVAGGVPVIRTLRDALAPTGVTAIRGILNGTTNFVLTRMHEGARFTDALAEAQALGFAEADPTRDLDGTDAADKIAILAWQAFGVRPDRLRIDQTGLVPAPEWIVADAHALGGVARLLAECVLLPTGVAAAVEPVIVSADSILAGASAEENVVEIATRSNGTIRLSGLGAGASPTASAILGDMLHAAPATPPRHDVVGAEDTRPHRWAISVRAEGDAATTLARAAERAGVEFTPAEARRTDGVRRFVTTPVTRARADLLVRALEAAGMQPLRLRLETSS